jgi:hypothetical protein
MHGIAQLMGRDGKEFVTSLELLLQLGYSSAEMRFFAQETALRAKVSAQNPTTPRMNMRKTHGGAKWDRRDPS